MTGFEHRHRHLSLVLRIKAGKCNSQISKDHETNPLFRSPNSGTKLTHEAPLPHHLPPINAPLDVLRWNKSYFAER